MKIQFSDYPIIRPIVNKDEMQLFMDWSFTIDSRTVWLPGGYACNCASIPRIFWSIIGSPFEPDLTGAAFAHDYLYLCHLPRIGRDVADEVLFQLLRQAGVGLWRARTIWAAVRSCGMMAWSNNRDDLADLAALRVMCANRPDGDKFQA